MRFFRKSTQPQDGLSIERIDQSLNDLDASIQKDVKTRKIMSKAAKILGWVVVGIVPVAFVVKPLAIFLLVEVFPITAAGYLLTKLAGFVTDRMLNDKYAAQAQLLEVKKNLSGAPEEVSPNTPAPAPEAAANFDAASRIRKLEEQVERLEKETSPKPVQIVKDDIAPKK